MCRLPRDILSNECNRSPDHSAFDIPLSDPPRIRVWRRRRVVLLRVVALVQSIAVLWKC
jgi:hypothetical protein